MCWTEEYRTGNLLIDGEHKQILDLLYHYIENKLPSRISRWDFIKFLLIDHVTVHFHHEEALMDIYSYSLSDKEEHVNDHKILKKMVEDLNVEPSENEIKSFLNYLETHISTIDKKLSSICV